jgi:hypothetical protein
VSGGAVPSPPSTNQVPMFSSGGNSKSALLLSAINLTPMESIIDRIKADIANIMNEIDLAHSTLHSFKARLVSIGISSAHKDEGPVRNIKISQYLYNSPNYTASEQDLIHERIIKSIKYKEDKQSDPKVAFPLNNMYNENNGDDAALIVQQNTAENIPLQPSEWQAESNKDDASAVLAGAIQLQYLYENISITFLDFFHNCANYCYLECLLVSHFVYMFQNQSIACVASSHTGPESPTHKQDDYGSNTIEHHGPVENHTAGEQDIHKIIKRIKACCKGTEMLMSVPSTGMFGEGGGGYIRPPDQPTL